MIRYNILANTQACQDFIDGVHLLKQAPWTDGLSIYDFFVSWHYQAMMVATPPQPFPRGSRRNRAHHGSVFLPWHRYLLSVFERYMRQALGNDEFRLPYYAFGVDADAPQRSGLWSPQVMGGTGAGPNGVGSGPFRRFGSDGRQWEVRMAVNPGSNRLQRTSRGLRRNLGAAGRIPPVTQVRGAASFAAYDTYPLDNTSQGGLRSYVEIMHNQVHNWVGGDMQTAGACNDPVFFLLHSYIDCIWHSWQMQHGVDNYQPSSDAPEWLRYHRLDDPLHSLYADSPRVRDVLDIENLDYAYDQPAW